MYCKYCGQEIDDNFAFCPYCGKRVGNAVEETLHETGVPHENIGGDIMLRAPLEFEVARRTKEKPQEEQEEQQEESLSDDTEIASLDIISPRTKKILMDNGLNTIGDVKDYGIENLRELPGFGRRGYYEIERLIGDNTHELLDKMDANTREYIQLQYKTYVYDMAKITVKEEGDGGRVVDKTKPLFIRARRLCRYWDSFEDMVKAVTSDNPKLPKSFHDIGGVTMKELKDFYNYTFKRVINDALEMEEWQVRDGIISLKFPFLTESQRWFVLDFEDKNGYTPIFYIIYNYVCQERNRYNMIISLKVGFNQPPMTAEKVRRSAGLKSIERVRQIVANGISFGPTFNGNEFIRKRYEDEYPQRKWFVELVEKNASHYRTVFSQRELTQESKAYQDTVALEHLSGSFDAFVKTVEAIKKLGEGTSAATFLTPALKDD